jgi:hypothetical protein
MLPLEFRAVFLSAVFVAAVGTLFVCGLVSLFRWRITLRTALVATVAAFVLLTLWAMQPPRWAPGEQEHIPIPLVIGGYA